MVLSSSGTMSGSRKWSFNYNSSTESVGNSTTSNGSGNYNDSYEGDLAYDMQSGTWTLVSGSGSGTLKLQHHSTENLEVGYQISPFAFTLEDFVFEGEAVIHADNSYDYKENAEYTITVENGDWKTVEKSKNIETVTKYSYRSSLEETHWDGRVEITDESNGHTETRTSRRYENGAIVSDTTTSDSATKWERRCTQNHPHGTVADGGGGFTYFLYIDQWIRFEGGRDDASRRNDA